MNRCRKALEHILFGQAFVSRVEFDEFVKVFEDFLDDGIDDIIGNFGRGNKGGFDAKSLDGLFGVGCPWIIGHQGLGGCVVGIF